MFHHNFSPRLKSLLTPGILATLWVSFGSVSSSIIAALSLIITSRLLDPAEFGIFSAQFSLVLLLARIFDFGINLAIQRIISKSTSPQIISYTFQTGLFLKFISWSLCLLVSLTLAQPLHQYLFTNREKIGHLTGRRISPLPETTLSGIFAKYSKNPYGSYSCE